MPEPRQSESQGEVRACMPSGRTWSFQNCWQSALPIHWSRVRKIQVLADCAHPVSASSLQPVLFEQQQRQTGPAKICVFQLLSSALMSKRSGAGETGATQRLSKQTDERHQKHVCNIPKICDDLIAIQHLLVIKTSTNAKRLSARGENPCSWEIKSLRREKQSHAKMILQENLMLACCCNSHACVIFVGSNIQRWEKQIEAVLLCKAETSATRIPKCLSNTHKIYSVCCIIWSRKFSFVYTAAETLWQHVLRHLMLKSFAAKRSQEALQRFLLPTY